MPESKTPRLANTGGDNKRVRYTVELTKRLDEVLGQIAEENDSTKAEVLRFAIDFLEAGVKAKKDGMTVGGWTDDPNGHRTKERVFIGL